MYNRFLDSVWVSTSSICLTTVTLVLLAVVTGCKDSAKVASSGQQDGSASQNSNHEKHGSHPINSDVAESDDVSASDILARLAQRYDRISTYRDEGVFDLSYRMDGQTIREPKKFATRYSTGNDQDPRDRIQIESFNGKVIGNGRVLQCRVFDLETANLENQNLLVSYSDGIPVQELLRDPIARHFLSGVDELPINEKKVTDPAMLLPAPVSLLVDRVDNPWLTDPTQCERLGDQKLGDTECFVVRSLANEMTCDLWISREDFQLIKMSLPVKLLAREVVASSQVTDVVVTARFKNIAIDEPVTFDDQINSSNDDQVWVQKFVALPESLPSDLLGKPVPPFRLRKTNGGQVDRLTFDQKTLVLIWVEGAEAISQIKSIQKVRSEFPNDVELGLVFAEAELKRRTGDQIEPLTRIVDLANNIEAKVFFDSKYATSSLFKVSKVPAVAVLDGDSVLQYVQMIDGEGWRDDLVASVQRIVSGDNLAAEIKQQYAEYLDIYYQQLETVNANQLAGMIEGSSRIKKVSSTTGTERIRTKPELLWRNREFQRPGNLVATASQSRFAVFDGWQTMGLLKSDGELLRRVRLQLAENEGATQVRSAFIDGGKSSDLFAVFSPFGEHVDVYPGDFGKAKKFNFANQKVRDSRFCDLDQNDQPELVVTTNHSVWLVDPILGDQQKLIDSDVSSVVGFSGDLIQLRNGKLTSIKTKQELTGQLAESSGWSVSHLLAFGDQQLVATGKTRAGRWNASAFDSNFKQLWSLQIGPQLFESSVHSIAATYWDGEIIWAIADSNHLIQLVSGSGKWIGEFQSPSTLEGMCLSCQEHGASRGNGQVTLTIANQQGVESWALNLSKQ